LQDISNFIGDRSDIVTDVLTCFLHGILASGRSVLDIVAEL
jgi:hypothetical protein